MRIKPEKIPSELKQISQWVLWKTVMRDGQATKLPYRFTGELAKSNDPETWGDFETALKRYLLGVWDGIGFVFSADDPYCGIDLDGCRKKDTGEISEWAKQIILEFSSYAEVSPSETGVKIWVRGSWPYSGNKQILKDMEPVSDKTPAIEVYDKLRYFAATGNALAGQTQIAERQDQLDALRKKYWCESTPTPKTDFRSASSVVERARKYLAKMPVSISQQGGHNACFHAACVLVLGFGLSDSEAMGLLLEWNQGCQPPWSERELQHKISSAQQQTGERGYLRNVSPQNFDKVSVPSYKSPPTKPEPRVTTLHDAAKKYVDSIRDGRDRLIDLGLPELDYAIGGGAEAGELVLIAARPSHGKSAVALQIVHHWTANGLPSLFVSEEMSAIALGKRTVQFASDIPQEHWNVRLEHVEHQIEEHFRERSICTIVESCKTADAAAEAIRKAKAESEVKCAVVDYAQLLGSPGRSRYEQITNTSVCLRQVATETQVLLLALCQLNREIESRPKFAPQMSDLKDTGQLEQDADVIIFSVWPHRIDQSKNPHEYQFFIAKNRNRGINQPFVTCRFEPSRQMFKDTRQTTYGEIESVGDDKDYF